MFDIDLFVHQVQQLLHDRDMAYRKGCDDICNHCRNKVDCNQRNVLDIFLVMMGLLMESQ